MLERLKKYVAAKRLTLNEAKTRLVNFQQDSFRFLGFDFAWRRSPRTGNRFVHVETSPKARLHLREAVREELNHWTKHRSCAEAVRRVNRITRSLSNTDHYGHSTRVFGRQQVWLQNRVRRWRWRHRPRSALGRRPCGKNDCAVVKRRGRISWSEVL